MTGGGEGRGEMRSEGRGGGMRGVREGCSHVWKVGGKFEARSSAGGPPARTLALSAQVNGRLPVGLHWAPGEGGGNIWKGGAVV